MISAIYGLDSNVRCLRSQGGMTRGGTMKFARSVGMLVWVFSSAVVAGYSQITIPVPTPSVTTNDATGVTSNSAQLNGFLVTGGGSSAGWFEWGTTTSLGKRTDPKVFSDGSATITLAATISNLNPHTTYYFRAVL